MRPLRLVVVIGTRPEAIKMMPIVVAARERPDAFDVRIARTGQHRGLVDDLMDEFGLAADVDLDVMRDDQSLAHVMAGSVRGLSAAFARDPPDWVLVQGDTITTFAGALAAFYCRVPVAHVEAGLRTGDRDDPFPEEINRAMTARIASLHCAPTTQARDNLRREGIDDEAIVVTGNTVVDAMRLTLGRPLFDTTAPRPSDARDRPPYVLVTVHRRDNHGAALLRICDGIERLLARHPRLTARLPVHPSPQVRTTLVERLGAHPRIVLEAPLGYGAFAHALDGATLVLTDSGGVQEECTVLGKPVLVLRSGTERPEAVAEGVARVVGRDGPEIERAASLLLDDAALYARTARPSAVFGDGHAAARILAALLARHGRVAR